jgi:hypothetical protein
MNVVAQVLLVAAARSQPAMVFIRGIASAVALAAISECCWTTRSVIGTRALLVNGPMCSSAAMTLAGLPVAPTRSRSVLSSCERVSRRSGVRPARRAPCCCAHSIAVVEMSGGIGVPLVPAPPVMTDVPPAPVMPALPGLPGLPAVPGLLVVLPIVPWQPRATSSRQRDGGARRVSGAGLRPA